MPPGSSCERVQAGRPRPGVRLIGDASAATVAGAWEPAGMVTVDDVRAVVAGLPRSEEVVVRDRVKLRVGRLVYASFSADETQLGFAFPKEERAALVAGRPEVFSLPRQSDLRFNWVVAQL